MYGKDRITKIEYSEEKLDEDKIKKKIENNLTTFIILTVPTFKEIWNRELGKHLVKSCYPLFTLHYHTRVYVSRTKDGARRKG